MKIGYWFFLCVVFFILGIIMGADYNKSNNHENVSAVIATPYIQITKGFPIEQGDIFIISQITYDKTSQQTDTLILQYLDNINTDSLHSQIP